MDFNHALEDARRAGGDDGSLSILLGNGFSIAASRTFAYNRLLDEAEFGGPRRDARIRAVFDVLGSADFELVVRRLEETAATLTAYPWRLPKTMRLLRRDSKAVRKGLTEAISKVHPDYKGVIGDGPMEATIDVLDTFDEVFTTNYDLLLYWAMGSNGFGSFNDGFGGSGDLTHIRPDDQTAHFLHGALHLWEEVEIGGEPTTYKLRWTRRSTLMQELRGMLRRDRYPLVVMEGTARQKQAAIDASPYLRGCMTSLRGLSGSLFTYGWAMSDNDHHILEAIAKSDVTRLYVGLFGKPRSEPNPSMISRAQWLRAATGRRVKVSLWNVETAGLW